MGPLPTDTKDVTLPDRPRAYLRTTTLASGWAEPGYHETALRMPGLAGGIYFCRMDAKGFSATRKLVLVK